MTTAPHTPHPEAATSREMHFFLAGWNGAVLNVDATEHFQKAQASASQGRATQAADVPVALPEPVAYLHPKGTCATTDLWYKEAGWLPLFTEPQLHPLPAGVSAPAAQAVEPTDEQLFKLWQSLPAQGDPTGQRFAIVFARAVLALQGAHSAPQAQAEARGTLTPAARDVLAERARQISTEGRTPDRDDQCRPGELLMAADSYISWNCGEYETGTVPINWPWESDCFKPATERRNLEKAGALILAEIERIDRAAIAAAKGAAA